MSISKTLIGAAALAVAAMTPQAASAQARSVGVLDLQAAVFQSNAFQQANTAIEAQFAAQIQDIQARSAAYQAELQTLQQNYNSATQQPNATQATVAPFAQALQAKQQEAQQALAPLQQPIQLARAYAAEQVQLQLEGAIRAVMTSTGTELIVSPQVVLFAANPQQATITDEVVQELNRRVQSVGTTPPAGWQPGQTAAQAQQPQQ